MSKEFVDKMATRSLRFNWKFEICLAISLDCSYSSLKVRLTESSISTAILSGESSACFFNQLGIISAIKNLLYFKFKKPLLSKIAKVKYRLREARELIKVR